MTAPRTQEAQGEEQPFRLWPALQEAVRGSRQDFTAGPIGRAILLLAVPMVLETVMESIFAVLELPLAYVLAHPLGMGPQGVFLSEAVAFSSLAVVSVVVFRKGRWKLREV